MISKIALLNSQPVLLLWKLSLKRFFEAFTEIFFSTSSIFFSFIVCRVVPLSSYSTASHAKGRFFCASVKGKNIIKSRHIRVNCVHFQSQHGLVFAQFFFFFFCRSSLLLSSSLSSSERQCGCKAEQPQIWGDYIFLKIRLSTHASFSTIIEASGSLSLFGFSYNLLVYTLGFRDGRMWNQPFFYWIPEHDQWWFEYYLVCTVSTNSLPSSTPSWYS